MGKERHDHTHDRGMTIAGLAGALLLGGVLVLGSLGTDRVHASGAVQGQGSVPTLSGSPNDSGMFVQAEALTSIEIDQTSLTVMKGQTVTLKVKKIDGNTPTITQTGQVSWSSTDTNIATVSRVTGTDSNGTTINVGQVMTKAVGRVTIKASYTAGGVTRTDECKLTIVAETPKITEAIVAHETFIYDGSTHTQSVTVKSGSTTLNPSQYTLKYYPETIRERGAYQVLAEGKSGTPYFGTSATATFYVINKPISDSDITISGFASEKLLGTDGSAATQRITVKRGTETLRAGVDYSVYYADNTVPGTATMIVQGMGSYGGQREMTFTVYDSNVRNMEVILSQTAYTYDGNPKKPSVTVKTIAGSSSRTLTPNTDYTLTYSNNTSVGTATVTVTGIGSYSGTNSQNFTIGRLQVAIPQAATNLTYTGSAQSGVATSSQYSLFGDVSETNAGSYTTIVALKGDNYAWSDGTTGSKSIAWEIKRRPVTFSVGAFAAPIYTGGPIEPELPITVNPTGATFTTTFTDNVNAGTATYALEATGNYVGTKTGTFTIKGAPITIKVDDVTKLQYTDDPNLTATITGALKTPKFNYTLSRVAGEAPGNYGITATPGNNPNYEVISNEPGTFTIIEVINPIAIDAIDDTNIIYTGTEICPALSFSTMPSDFGPEFYDLEYYGNINAGTATVVVTGKGKYEGKESVAHFTIHKRNATISINDVSKIKGENDPRLTATVNGTAGTDALSYTLTRSEGEVVGTYPITARLGENPNYNVTVIRNGTFTIRLRTDNEMGNYLYFCDVNAHTSHRDEIEWLAANGISTGWGSGDNRRFCPTDKVIRADMAAFLFRLGQRAHIIEADWKPSAATRLKFIDVDEKTPHAREIWWLAETRISSGWEIGTHMWQFRPYETVARQDMAAFMFRFAIEEGLVTNNWTAANFDDRHVFIDVTDRTSHSREIWWVAKKGISTGWPTTAGREFRGMESVSRQDMAAFLYRLDNLRNA